VRLRLRSTRVRAQGGGGAWFSERVDGCGQLLKMRYEPRSVEISLSAQEDKEVGEEVEGDSVDDGVSDKLVVVWKDVSRDWLIYFFKSSSKGGRCCNDFEGGSGVGATTSDTVLKCDI
jgi:hypothetical protein